MMLRIWRICFQAISGAWAVTSGGRWDEASPMIAKFADTALMVFVSVENDSKLIPRTNERISALALRISVARSGQGLRDTNGLGENAVSDVRFQACGCADIHRAAEQLREVVLELVKTDQRDWSIKLDQNVNVAVRAVFAAGDRAEDEDRADAKPGREVRARLVKELFDLVEAHDE